MLIHHLKQHLALSLQICFPPSRGLMILVCTHSSLQSRHQWLLLPLLLLNCCCQYLCATFRVHYYYDYHLLEQLLLPLLLSQILWLLLLVDSLMTSAEQYLHLLSPIAAYLSTLLSSFWKMMMLSLVYCC